jgi:hypothetical protein
VLAGCCLAPARRRKQQRATGLRPAAPTTHPRARSNDYDDLAALARTLNEFERGWNEVAEPFEWNFTRDDLAKLIDRLAAHEPQLRLAA